MVLRHFKCNPRNAIHIGDILKTDIKGAKDLKMHTIWIKDSISSKSEIIQADYEIKEISEAIKIINTLNSI